MSLLKEMRFTVDEDIGDEFAALIKSESLDVVKVQTFSSAPIQEFFGLAESLVPRAKAFWQVIKKLTHQQNRKVTIHIETASGDVKTVNLEGYSVDEVQTLLVDAQRVAVRVEKNDRSQNP